jgi:hypothetical protein
MPYFDAGQSGLTGTVGVTIRKAGAEHVARSVVGITEPVAGSGVYYIADHDTTETLTYVWDVGAGTIGASETLIAGRDEPAAIADAVCDEVISTGHAVGNSVAAVLNDIHGDVGTVATNIGDPVGDDLSDDIAAVKSSVGTPMQAGTAVTLDGDYDAAMSAASQDSVDDLSTLLGTPTSPVTTIAEDIETRLAAVDYVVIGDPMQAGTEVELTGDYDAAKAAASQDSVNALGTPLQAGTYEPPDNTTVGEIAAALGSYETETTVAEELAAVKAKTDTLGAAEVEVTTPVLSSGDVELVSGDAYTAAHGRALAWTADVWPDLGEATVTFHAGELDVEAVVTESEDGQTITVELSAADTTALGAYDSVPFFVVAEWAGAEPATLCAGDVFVTESDE